MPTITEVVVFQCPSDKLVALAVAIDELTDELGVDILVRQSHGSQVSLSTALGALARSEADRGR